MRILTPPRRARLERLANYLESLRPRYRHFDMLDFVGDGGDRETVKRYALQNGGVPACGTVACAIGHGPAAGILFPPRMVGDQELDWNGYAKLFIGQHDWGTPGWPLFEWMFGSNWVDVDNHHYGAAARIRYVLANGKPPPAFFAPAPRWTSHYKAFRKPLRDSGRLPKGEDSRSEAECEASQSGGAAGDASPKTPPHQDQTEQ